MAVATVRRLFPSIDADALASTMRVVYGVARATGGVAVAPYHRLSERQQLEFKVANRISGVTWTRVRAFLGGAASVLASREVSCTSPARRYCFEPARFGVSGF